MTHTNLLEKLDCSPITTVFGTCEMVSRGCILEIKNASDIPSFLLMILEKEEEKYQAELMAWHEAAKAGLETKRPTSDAIISLN